MKPQKDTPPKNANIWVVDDEITNFMVVEMLLSQEPYDLTHFTHAFELPALVQAQLPDLILMDVMMPGINGIEACYRLKSTIATRHIPVLMVTALNSKEDLARCLEAGADDFVSKPVNGLELRARIRSLLRMKRQHDELQQLVNVREEILQLRTDLSNMVIHDLRNPLANILLSCQLLQMYDSDDRTQRKIEQIEYSSHRLESMIDSLLITAKLESGKLRVEPTPIDLQQLIHSVAEEFAAIAHQQRVSIELDLATSPVFTCGDAILLRRVLDNLLSNALKFSPTDSSVTITLTQQAAVINLQVSDQGSGVNPELREQIFAKFEIGQHLPQVKQMGLGLAFCKMAIEAHDGHIAVEDNLPRGCSFTIHLAAIAAPTPVLTEFAT
jgi:two-component system, sensor histidine kinase and response regulator